MGGAGGAARGAEDLAFRLGLLAVFCVGLLVTARYAFLNSVPFPDTYTYLEPWRNLFEGRGFVTRYNVAYGWSGEFARPALAYYNPLYGLWIALPFRLLDNPAWVGVFSNALPCAVNAVLLGLLVRRAFGTPVALLSALGYVLLPTTWVGMTLICAEHATVGVLLLALLVIELRARADERAWIWVGVVLGVGTLVKVSVLLVAPVLAAAAPLVGNGALRARLVGSVRPVAWLAAGFAAIAVPYGVACLVVVGELYPVYPGMARNWALATAFGGSFVAGSPAVRPDAAALPGLAQVLEMSVSNVGTMLWAGTRELGLLALFLPVAFLGARGRALELALLLAAMGLVLAVGHAVSFNFVRIADYESPRRYALYSAAFWYPLAVLGVGMAAGRIARARPPRWAWLVVFWSLLSLPLVGPLRARYENAAAVVVPKMLVWQRLMEPIGALVGEDELVAVRSGPSLFLDRPVVVLPAGKMATREGLAQFIAVFEPAMVIPREAWMGAAMPALGYRPRSVGGGLVVYTAGGSAAR